MEYFEILTDLELAILSDEDRRVYMQTLSRAFHARHDEMMHLRDIGAPDGILTDAIYRAGRIRNAWEEAKKYCVHETGYYVQLDRCSLCGESGVEEYIDRAQQGKGDPRWNLKS